MSEIIGFHASDRRWFICFVVWVLRFYCRYRQIFLWLCFLCLIEVELKGSIQILHYQLTSLLQFKQGFKVGQEDSLVGKVLTEQAREPKFPVKPSTHVKSRLWHCASSIPAQEGEETGRSLEFPTSRSTITSELQV